MLKTVSSSHIAQIRAAPATRALAITPAPHTRGGVIIEIRRIIGDSSMSIIDIVHLTKYSSVPYSDINSPFSASCRAAPKSVIL